MTRKEFLTNMIRSILGYSIIDLKKSENDKIEYIKAGTTIKDCTYTSKYRDKIVRLICSLFDKNVKQIQIEKNIAPSEIYHKKAKDFIITILNMYSTSIFEFNAEKVNSLKCSDIEYIYKYIIIKEIFEVDEHKKQSGNDDFTNSEKSIVTAIKKYIEYSKSNQEYKERKQAFLESINNHDDYTSGSEFDIFYKSSELGRKFIDIREYMISKDLNFIVLNNNNIHNFNKDTIYRYTGECFLNSDENSIIVSFEYNNQKIWSYTSRRNWLNQSIVSNYLNNKFGRYFNCYFFCDQGKVFKFLQISEADITAEI